MRAILTSVNYSDLLSITLSYNRRHFDQVMIVTDGRSYDSVRRVVDALGCDQNYIHVTECFYADGARFNKFRALEEGLDVFGRFGWLTIMDSDILWPKAILGSSVNPRNPPAWLCRGCLHTPLRRMWTSFPHNPLPIRYTDAMLGGVRFPSEEHWAEFPPHPQQREFAGYSQTFHCDDLHLGPPPWHQTDWTHCGGADSFFQAKWPEQCKIRPPFEVLHLGPAGTNWLGRSSPYADGTIPVGAEERKAALRDLIRRRSGSGEERFRHERLGG